MAKKNTIPSRQFTEQRSIFPRWMIALVNIILEWWATTSLERIIQLKQANRLCMVLVRIGDDDSHAFLVRLVDVDNLFIAFYRLHVNPGFNPHSTEDDRRTSRMSSFTVYAVTRVPTNVSVRVPYWWSTPNLRSSKFNDPRHGVPLVQLSVSQWGGGYIGEVLTVNTWSISEEAPR